MYSDFAICLNNILCSNFPPNLSSNPGSCITFNYHVLMVFLSFSLSFMMLVFVKRAHQLFGGMLINLGLSDTPLN